MKIFFIPNGHTSKKHSNYVVFIKHFENSLESKNTIFSRTSLIQGRIYETLKKIRT